MIKIENIEVVGWEHAIRGMRNPMNSWNKSDSGYCCGDKKCSVCDLFCDIPHFVVRENDLDLMEKLVKAGTDHRKFMRMIVVYVDITAPMYWWKEFDTYKVGTVRNSCSTMHKIQAKKFTSDDFSDEWLLNREEDLIPTINKLNRYRELFIETKDKVYWWQMIQLLPSSYNQRSTVMLNYEVLSNMYHSRKNHKLDEWREFCDWIEKLPYSELITGEKINKSMEEM